MSEMKNLFSMTGLAVAVGLALAPMQAQAQSWDWGGEKQVASSGKAIVAVDKSLKPDWIYVSFSDRKLYFITKPGEAFTYPIAIPRQQDDWKGQMLVSDKKVNPSWTPTPTMIKENPRLPSWVPGGHPYNPLGVRALYLGSSAYRIHGTDAPWTIGEPVSKGCIRMYNKDVVELYDRVKIGTKVTVGWESYANGMITNPGQPVREASAGAAGQNAAARSAEPSREAIRGSQPRDQRIETRPRGPERRADASQASARDDDARYNAIFGTAGAN